MTALMSQGEVINRRLADIAARTAERLAAGQGLAAQPPATRALAVPVAQETEAAGQGSVARHRKDIPGDRLLNTVDAWLGTYVRYPDDHARHIAALWAAHAHFRDGSGVLTWPATPRLVFVAPPGCGKTTAAETEGMLCAPWFYGLDTNPTAPGLCHTIHEERAVTVVDEFHRLVGPKGVRKADVVSIMNSGYRPNGTYLNARGSKANRIPVFGAMVIAGHESLLKAAADELGDLLDRSIVIRMAQVPEGEEPPKPVTQTTRAQGGQLAALLAQWAAQEQSNGHLAAAVEVAWQTCTDAGLRRGTRAAEIWQPLLTVAALASPGHLNAAVEAAQVVHGRRPAIGAEERLAEIEDMLGIEAGAGWGTQGAGA